MPSYRLLRSNKESGPYSLNDLVTLGLKPYDLVWVDGRSAAWRYPSEVAELMDYAPAIEEQPYDRFYKKPSESETTAIAATSPHYQEPIPQRSPGTDDPMKKDSILQRSAVNENTIKQEPVAKVIKEEPAKKPAIEVPNPAYQAYQPQKKVFVSMPENNGFNQYQQYLPKSKPVEEKQTPVEKPSPVPERSYSPIDIHEPEEATLETKYTQSLDDIKEMYINTLVQRKTRNRRKEIFRKYLKPALAPLFLLIAGVAIGFVINYRKSPKVVQSLSTVVPQQTLPVQNDEQNATGNTPAEGDQILQPEEKQSLGEKQNLVLNTDSKKKQTKPSTQVSILSEKHNKNVQLVPKSVASGKKQNEAFVPNEEVSSFQKKNVQVDPNTGERNRAIRDNDEIVTKEITANNSSERLNKKNNPEPSFLETERKSSIRDFVSVKTNNYVRGAFGGIRGLELVVYNTSDFLVDEVSIELQIMKPSEQPLRTDIITVKNIASNGAVRIRVPDSQRGIRVDYRITHVESRQWQRSTAGL